MLCIISLITINCLFYIKEANLAIAVRKFVHQKDMSEHCRRRVVPSVFLGKHVVDANSQILHFSQLEMPYSCSISVRTEFGNNIILVIQLLSDRNLLNSCRKNNDQLLIYELGETFGGYWGALPDALVEFKPQNYTKYYTLKTTPSTVQTSVTDKEYEDIDAETKMNELLSHRASEKPEEDFIRIDVPLVNISGDLGLDEFSSNKRFDTDELFDLLYDVTPRNGGVYDTSIIPLVQFSIKKEKEDQYNSNYLLPKYELDYSFQGFTPDSRITYNTMYKKKVTRIYKGTKRLKFRRKNKSLFRSRTSPIYKDLRAQDKYTTNSYQGSRPVPTIKENLLSEIYNNSAVKSGNSWEFIDDLMKSFLTTHIGNEILTDSFLNLSVSQNMSDLMYTSSAMKVPPASYLRQNSSLTSGFTVQETTEPTITANVKFFNNNSSVQNTKSLELNISTASVEEMFTTVLEDTSEYIDDVKIVFTSNASEHKSGYLVNHKSFENVVQAAPEIAVVLNRHNKENQTTKTTKKEVNLSSQFRNKRFINALEIENARPRNLTTLKARSKTTEKVYRYSDMQDLAQLVELQDDEIQDRVALRYLRKYVGPALFNICEYHEPKARQVYLFNSSRIVIAVSNFTMDRMTLVVTPARTLASSVGRCPPAHLECQVAGTRVCIDSTNACDGVPNCGAYDIYDEDRLRCGWSIGLQHNVCLAACTFLAVLLTVMYTIHYWLKRCVPRVSEAFFIFSDASENTLFLDPIMRTPNDNTDDYSKLFYQANIFEDDEEFLKMTTKASWCSRIKSFLLACLFCKKRTDIAKECIDESSAHAMISMTSVPRKVYSFTEQELRDIAPLFKDATVQTGSSLEIPDKKIRNEAYQSQFRVKPPFSTDCGQTTENNEISSELNLLKLIRNLKISSKESSDSRSDELVHSIKNDNLNRVPGTEEEKELHSTLYEPSTSVIKKKTTSTAIHPDSHSKKSKPVLSKRLRFDEDIITIPSPEYEEDDSVRDQNIVGVGSSRHLNTIEEIDEHGSSSNDFIRFWRTGKNKKSQKKSHLSLH